MDTTKDLFNELSPHGWDELLAGTTLNDYHFTPEEKRRGAERLEQRLKAADASLYKIGDATATTIPSTSVEDTTPPIPRQPRWRRWAVAATVAALVAAGALTLWHTSLHLQPSTPHQTLVTPRNLDMVLTTTDGHSLNLSEGGQLVCSEMGYLTIKGFGEALTINPAKAKLTAGGQSPTADASSPTSGLKSDLCELRVPEGKRTQVELSDGSRLWVNSATTVWFPIKFSGSERRIILSGEAYLEVAHRADSPFYVDTDSFCVRVLGTKFGVSAYPGKEARVVLAEGRVEVLKSADSGHFVLAPNQMLTITDGHATMEEAEAYTYIAWKDGLLYFNGTTVGEALSWLAKQYAVDISCTPKSASLKLYGKLILEEHVESVLDNLTVIEPIAYEVRNNQVIVRYDKE